LDDRVASPSPAAEQYAIPDHMTDDSVPLYDTDILLWSEQSYLRLALLHVLKAETWPVPRRSP
jgi:hypothetical protein